MTLALTLPGASEKLKISPEELKLRVSVAHRLSAPLRLRLRDLAANTPLPTEGGVLQTETIIDNEFPNISKAKRQLVQYYFLLARLEKSQDFSQEFLRRSKACEEGLELLDAYVGDLNNLISRALFRERVKISVPEPGSFPLGHVGWRESSGGVKVLDVLRTYPEPKTEMGRGPLRELRKAADADRDRLQQRIEEIELAEQEFLAEASLIGSKLREMRRPVSKLVRGNRAGLPFSF